MSDGPISGAEMADLYGEKLPPKMEMILIGERLFRREVDGSWSEYTSRLPS